MKYLIFRNDGIGDFINTTPLIKKITENDKGCEILLVASSRNYEYVKLFKQIDQIEKLSESPAFNEISELYTKIIKFKPDYSIVLKPKYYNYFLSKFSKSKKKLGLKVITDARNKRLKKNKPHLSLINFLMNQYETIDYSNNYTNDRTHHSIHFTRLASLIFNVEKINSINQIEYLKPDINNSSNNLVNDLKLNNLNQNFVLLHIDEKWNDTNWSIEDFISFFSILRERTKKNIIITEGVIRTKFYLSLLEKYKFDQSFDCSDSFFKVCGNGLFKTIFVASPSIELLTSIVSNSDLVIELHGALTHISSTFNIPVIDLCKVDYVNYFKKWKPISSRSIQIPHGDKDTVLEEINNFFIKNDLDQT
tara:strand:- start:5397 stop:6488 length:1092 start_codon:yes stop_codon:yes gene_type:complete